MNDILEDILYWLDADEEDYLNHEGVSILDGAPGRGSGRYALGSGETAYQRPGDFRQRVLKMRREGLSDIEIAQITGFKSAIELKNAVAIDKNAENEMMRDYMRKRRDEGETNRTKLANELTEKLGRPIAESTLRGIEKEESIARQTVAKTTADFLKEIVDTKGPVDIGPGAELEAGGVSRAKFDQAVDMLKEQGYEVRYGSMDNVTDPTGDHRINMTVLCPPGAPKNQAYQLGEISSIIDYDKVLRDDGDNIRKRFEYPASLDSSRIKIRYADEVGPDGLTGNDKDGLIEIRRGTEDLTLGNSHYAQVRILVDGTHYMKGMAVYSDDLPDGVDVVYNVHYPEGTPPLGTKNNTVLKVAKSEEKSPGNPFGSLIKNADEGGQFYYDDPEGKYTDLITGKKQSLSPINIKSAEGDWSEWSDKVPAQFLAKQPQALIDRQIKLTKADALAEFEEIKALTNPTVKRALLAEFASQCDADAVNLKMASFPDQKYKVILPLNIKDNEIYAPGYADGTTVALIRYPHGGQFEIPVCVVNNKNPDGKKMIGAAAKDAVGISKNNAEKLSGADYDGDTVMVIPFSDKVTISSKPRLKGLEGFDDKLEYGGKPEGTFKQMTNTQNEMGMITNLITDMQLKGAGEDEIARAVRHSMVIIDAEKHNLDYQQSFKDNQIAELKKKYMGHTTSEGKYSEGASTLISAAKSETQVTKTQGTPNINQKGKPWYDPSLPEGELIYKVASDDKRFYTDQKTGKIVERTKKTTKMAATRDPYELVSDRRTAQELAYADYAKFMKDLANEARKEQVYTGLLKQNKEAAKTYASEVQDLNAKLTLYELNKPRERAAQRIANQRVAAQKVALNEKGLSSKEKKEMVKKLRQQAITEARIQTGSKRKPVDFTPREWEAIQAGAISDSKLKNLLEAADSDKVRKLATPRKGTQFTSTEIARAKALAASGYTLEQIAERLGRSSSAVASYI